MNDTMRLARASSSIVIGICAVVTAASGNHPSLIPTGADVGTVRFDAILELDAPILETYAVLFARYWVSKDHYTIGMVWAEPHIGSLNFPIYPVSVVIHSTSGRFEISHQVHDRVDSQFFKPLGISSPLKKAVVSVVFMLTCDILIDRVGADVSWRISHVDEQTPA